VAPADMRVLMDSNHQRSSKIHVREKGVIESMVLYDAFNDS